MTYLLRRILASLVTLIVAAHARAYEAGWMQIQTPGATPGAPMTTVALYYPTMDATRTIAMGPFSLNAAIGAKPVNKVKALILLSHGLSGSELGHSALAQALARNGYLVAALRHPGDNWQDRSLMEKSPERYFDERSATMVYVAELDRFLVPRFHAEWVASNLPAPNMHRVPNAWHFAFMDRPSMLLPSPDGDVAANPPGFDRDAFLKQLAVEVTAFFDKTLN